MDQLAAVTSGLTSMVGGAARMFGAGPVAQIVVAMERGLLIVTAISDSIAFSTLAAADCDMGLVAGEMTVLGEQASEVVETALAVVSCPVASTAVHSSADTHAIAVRIEFGSILVVVGVPGLAGSNVTCRPT